MKKLNEFNNLNEAINYIERLKPSFPKKPSKPILSNNHNSKGVQAYSKLLEVYEHEMTKYRAERDIYTRKSGELNNILEEHIKDISGLKSIPEQYQDKVYAYAYQEGHSGGYHEVYNYLCELVDIFN